MNWRWRTIRCASTDIAPCGYGKQDDVLCQCLGVGQDDGIPEASAVGDGVIKVDPQGDGGHESHEQGSEDCRQLLVHAQKIVHAYEELHQGYEHGDDVECGTACHQRDAEGPEVDSHGPDIGFKLVLHAEGVGCLDKA